MKVTINYLLFQYSVDEFYFLYLLFSAVLIKSELVTHRF